MTELCLLFDLDKLKVTGTVRVLDQVFPVNLVNLASFTSFSSRALRWRSRNSYIPFVRVGIPSFVVSGLVIFGLKEQLSTSASFLTAYPIYVFNVRLSFQSYNRLTTSP